MDEAKDLHARKLDLAARFYSNAHSLRDGDVFLTKNTISSSRLLLSMNILQNLVLSKACVCVLRKRRMSVSELQKSIQTVGAFALQKANPVRIYITPLGCTPYRFCKKWR